MIEIKINGLKMYVFSFHYVLLIQNRDRVIFNENNYYLEVNSV